MELFPLFFLVHRFSTLFCIFLAWPFSSKEIKELKGSREQGRHGHVVKLLKLLVRTRLEERARRNALYAGCIRLSNVLCFVNPFLCTCDCLCQQDTFMNGSNVI